MQNLKVFCLAFIFVSLTNMTVFSQETFNINHSNNGLASDTNAQLSIMEIKLDVGIMHLQEKLNGLDVDLLYSKLDNLDEKFQLMQQKLERLDLMTLERKIDQLTEKVDKLDLAPIELKLNQLDTAAVETKLDKLHVNVTAIETKVEGLDLSPMKVQLEGVQDQLDKLNQLEAKLEVNLTSIETKVDDLDLSPIEVQLEGVQDQLDKLNQLEAKLEVNLTSIETKVDRINLETAVSEIKTYFDEKVERISLETAVSEIKTYFDENIYTPTINTYTVHYSIKTWPNARADCQRRGMDLASINSMAEREYVVGLITSACSVDGFWIAAHKTNGVWVWANDNTAVDPQLWRVNQPSGNGPYGKLWTTYYLEMDDDREFDSLCYICESTGN